MKIIILEGIASSGKTTVKNYLLSEFKKNNISFKVVEEEKTLMPILENTDKIISLKFLTNILKEVLNKDKDIIIFDRLFFTHIFRTTSDLIDFKSIEDMLLKYDVLLVLLMVQEGKIAKRIFGAMSHRGEGWRKFVKRKGSNKEIIEYYKNQQQFLLNLTSQSSIPHSIEDSTDMNFERIKRNILEKINKNY